MRTRPWYLILFALFATLGATPRLITETDLYAFHWLADPRIAPDGSQVVYTLVSVNARHDGYETALWIVSTQGGTPRRLTSGPHDAQARLPSGVRGKRMGSLRRQISTSSRCRVERRAL